MYELRIPTSPDTRIGVKRQKKNYLSARGCLLVAGMVKFCNMLRKATPYRLGDKAENTSKQIHTRHTLWAVFLTRYFSEPLAYGPEAGGSRT